MGQRNQISRRMGPTLGAVLAMTPSFGSVPRNLLTSTPPPSFQGELARVDRHSLSLSEQPHWIKIQMPGYVSQRCVTPVGVCFMPQAIPVGYPCFCPTPYGTASGRAG
jgi:hypothetical protein